MGVLWMRARAQLRGRARANLFLALLVGLAGALVLAAAAVCALVATVTFGASLVRLVGDPRAYGVTWDLQVGNFADAKGPERAARKLAANADVVAYRGIVGGVGPLVEGRSMTVLSFATGKGSLGPVVVEGREPIRPDEAALGATTMRALGRRIGDTMVVSGAGEPQRLRVVGRVVINEGDASPVVAPGKGVIVHADLWRRLSPPPTGAWPSCGCNTTSPTPWPSRSSSRS